MKTRVGLLILAVVTMIGGSCANYSCPTYNTSRGHNSSATASVKKGKPSKKGATPYYKTLRLAEE